MHNENELLHKFRQFVDEKQDISTFIDIIKTYFKANEVYFYDYRYDKPFIYPHSFPYKGSLYSLKTANSQVKIGKFTAYPLSKNTFLIVDIDNLSLNSTTSLLIESLWKYSSYRQYVNVLSMILDYVPDMIAFKDTTQFYLYANKKAQEKWPHLETLIHKHVSDVYPATEVARIIEMDKVAYNKGSQVKSVFEMLSENGTLMVESLRVPIKQNGRYEGILTINRDITSISQIENELKRSYDFQDILIKIASLFINVPIERADEAISNGLGMVGIHISADRVYVFDYDFDTLTTSNTHEYCAEGIEPVISYLQNQPIESIDAFWMESHKQHQSVYIPDIEEMNHESLLYQTLKMQDIKSLLTIPLYDNHKLYGFVGFDAVTSYAKWSEAEQQLLKVLAELIVNLKVRQAQHDLLYKEKQNALQASKTKSEFLANMSHEIRTPLSGINNALYLLKNTNLTPEQQDYLEIAKSSVESLGRIVNNILDLSKIEAGKLELEMSSFDIENEIYQLIKMQEYSAIEKGILLVMDFDYSIIDEVISDRIRFRQIMLNLVSNAVKYTEKGRVVVKTQKLYQNDTHMGIRFDVIDTGIGVSKKDLVKITDQFYQVDASITKKYAGTGLGLSIVKRLLNLINSELEISSELGVGSTFGFTLNLPIGVRNPHGTYTNLKDKSMVFIDFLPQYFDNAKRFFTALCPQIDIKSHHDQSSKRYDYIMIHKDINEVDMDFTDDLIRRFGNDSVKIVICSRETYHLSKHELLEKGIDAAINMPITRERANHLLSEANAPKSIVHATQKSALLHKNILVVDDNKVNRQAMQIILSKQGLEVILSSSGQDAIDKAQYMQIDMILMDIQMPEMDGYEAARRIRGLGDKYKTLPIIAVTANATEAANEEAIASGMNGSITKPFKPEMLLEIIQDIFETQSEIEPESFTIKDLNEEALKEAYHHDEGLIEDILKTFLEDYDEQTEKLLLALNNKDYLQIEKVTHYLKGSTNYLFAEKSAKSCQNIMNLFRQNHLDLVKPAVIQLLEELSILKNIMQNMLKS